VDQPPFLLGRGVVVRPGAEVPEAWIRVQAVAVGDQDLRKPDAIVERLHRHWLGREPVVIHLQVDPKLFRRTETWTVEPYELSPRLTPWFDRLHFLVWANNYDVRPDGTYRWAGAEAAVQRLGAGRPPDDRGDILLPDGRAVWVDGGPREPLRESDLGLPVVHWETVEANRLRVMPEPRPSTADLAPDQAAAVAHRCGPARVIAPAGSGKTRVLTERLRHLRVDRDYEKEKVLALAYNVRARGEMEARCADFGPRIQTLNALGYEIVREVRGHTEVLDEVQVRRVLEPLLPPLERRLNTDPLVPYLAAVSGVRQMLRPPTWFEKAGEEVEGLSAAFPRYRAELRSLGAVDYDEQLYAAVEALLRDHELRHDWQKRCRHLLVDEFQDLTPLHLLMIRVLSIPTLDVFGVGDDDQVIYGHAGATPDYLIGFDSYFPGAAHYALRVNYRCPRTVVEAAARLLGYNQRRVEKEIVHGPSAAEGESAFRIVEHEAQEAVSTLLTQVRAWLAKAGVEPRHIAILTRVNASLLAPQVALLDAGIPVHSTLGPALLERTGVRAALAYLRLATAGDAMLSEDLQLVFRRPNRGLAPSFRDVLARRERWSVRGIRAIQVEPRDVPKLKRLFEDLERLQRWSATKSTREMLMLIRSDIGLAKALSTLDVPQHGDLSSHADDLEGLEQAATLHRDPRTFETWLRSVFRRSADPEGVVLATVHRTKGQEWDHVLVYGAVEGLMPHRLALEELEEERRVMHVAVTRGREEVVVLASAERQSRFLDELRGLARKPQPVVPAAPRRPSRPVVSTAPAPSRDVIRPNLGDTLRVRSGHTGVVIFRGDGGAHLRLEAGGNLLVPWGETVWRGQESGVLSRPNGGGGGSGQTQR
jgi:DNA helicase-2/ATP-dependent DNA helicase PcrA